MAVSKVMNLGIEVTLDAKGAIKGIKQVEGAVTRAGKKARTASKGFRKLKTAVAGLGLTMGAAGLVRGVSAAVKAFGDFEEQLKNVQNITGMSAQGIGEFKAQIEALPSSLGSSVELTKGLYQALSAGIPKENAISFIEVSAMAAKGNLADLTQTISATASIINAFGLETSETADVLDAMTKTVDLGVLTFSDLSNNIGKAAAMAAAAGVSYDELFAATAQLTKGGLSVEESITGIRAMMNAMISPTTEASKAMERLGIDMSVTRLKSDGLVAMMQDLANVVGDDIEAMAELFPNLRALGPALTLAANGGRGLEESLLGIIDANGKVEDNFANMSQSVSAQMDAMKVDMQKMMQLIGEEISPVVLELGAVFLAVMPSIAGFFIAAAEAVGSFVESLRWVGGFLAPILEFTKGVEGLNTMLVATAVTAGVVKVAMMGFAGAMGPVTAAVLAIVGAVAAFNLVVSEMEKRADEAVGAQNSHSDALKQMGAGMDAAKKKTGEMVDELNVNVKAHESTHAAILRTLQEQEALGIITEEYAAILSGTSVKQIKLAEVLEESNLALKEAAKVTEANAEETKKYVGRIKALTKEIASFGKKMESSAKKAKTSNRSIIDGFGGVVTAIEGVIDAFMLGEIAADQMVEGIAGAMTELDRAIQLHTAENTRTLEEMFDTLPAVAEGAAGEVVDIITEIPTDLPKDLGKRMSAPILGGLSDVLGKGFMGEWNTFADLWDSLWQDAAKTITGRLGDAFSDLLTGTGSIGDMMSALDQGIGGIVGGLGMVMQAREQGGAQGALQGAMGGGTLGASIGGMIGPAGAIVGGAIGAFIGAVVSFFGGNDAPNTHLNLGRNVSNLRVSNQDMSQEEVDLMAGRMRSLYDNAQQAYRSIVLQFNDASLFDEVLRDSSATVNLGMDAGGNGMSAEAVFEWLRDSKLPELFENQFFGAINTGLQNLGVNAATVTTLFDELGTMVGSERVEFLAKFVATVVKLSRSLEMADWDDFRAAMDQDIVSAFIEGIEATTDEMDALMDSWKKMSLEDITNEIGAIGDAFDAALAGVANMLSAIDDARKGIQDGWEGMRESLMLSGLDDSQKADYFAQQLEGFINDLQSATTLEGITEANAAAMAAMQALMGVVDPNEIMANGMTWGEYMNMMMDEAESAATAGLDVIEDRVHDAYDSLVERLQAASDALLNFTDAANGVGDVGDVGDVGGEGYYDPESGEWIAGAHSEHDGGKTLNLTQPITIQVQTYIDGQQLRSSVQAQVSAQIDALQDWVLNLTQTQEVID